MNQTIEQKSAPSEEEIYNLWEQQKAFQAKPDSTAEPFTIMIPPPNVTGSLHIGHALTMTLQDLLVRWRRMQGKDSLWLPGTDHAGIATQLVVERQLEANGQSRHALGREAFLEKIWEWKQQSGGNITKQLRKLGSSLDWSRERFTMDEGMSRAVQESFVTLYKQGLIYQANRLVNWDIKFQSAISDLEVINKETKGFLYYIKYPLSSDNTKFLTVATTRPETLLGDVAIAVHPEDERYKNLLGEKVVSPLTGRLLPIIADEYSDPEKGTGAVKITPGHDFNDFMVGERHSMPVLSVFDAQGRITVEQIQNEFQEIKNVSDLDFVRSLVGTDRLEARKQVVERLDTLGLLEKTDPHVLQVPYAERSNMVVEPRLTTQWFCDAETLAKPAIEAVETGKIQFYPQQWENTYFSWMTNIQPWCISRQLWWGHRIPAWYGPDGQVFVDKSAEGAQEQAQKHYGSSVELTQDEDVLDTWFSSSLWPFSTLGWPDKTPDLAKYYPGDVLVSGFDIIFFWVARMIMMGMHLMGDVPFKKVYMHGLVRDEQGQKMSKTKGNVIDPLELMGQYGTDALRWAICGIAGPGRNMNLGPSTVELSRSFVTKLKNAARFFEMNNVKANPDFDPKTAKQPLNVWLLSELDETIKKVNESLEEFRFDMYADSVYKFTWNVLCDWFIELSKSTINAPESQEIRDTASYALQTVLRLLHPAIPFTTEEIWHQFGFGELGSLITSSWPTSQNITDKGDRTEVNWIISFITAIRNIRAEMKIEPKQNVQTYIDNKGYAELVERWSSVVQRLAKVSEIKHGSYEKSEKAEVNVGNIQVEIPLAGLFDVDVEINRLTQEIAKVEKDAERLSGQLSNDNFVSRAPPEVVEESRAKLQQANDQLVSLKNSISRFKSLAS